MNPKEIVTAGYNRAAKAYDRVHGHAYASRTLSWLTELTSVVPTGTRILDLGCGSGIPVATHLARDYLVTGVDISPIQLDRARRLIPHAEFFCADMLQVGFPARSFEAEAFVPEGSGGHTLVFAQ